MPDQQLLLTWRPKIVGKYLFWSMAFTNYHPAFITITCLEWKHFLKYDTCKRAIIDALIYRIHKQEVEVYGFVLMPNHMHLIWRIADHISPSDFQRDFLKYTAKNILLHLESIDKTMYQETFVESKDRTRQIWERNSLSKEIFSDNFFLQKLDYIHNNPIQEKWNLANSPEEYRWSSAAFYHSNNKEWFFLKDYRE